MDPVKITVLRKLRIEDLFDEYADEDFESECPIFNVGDEFVAREDFVPEGFCRWAWADIFRDVVCLSGGGNYSHIRRKGVMISGCTGGLRSVIFKLERMRE
jgi:uncharacterized repeat protein (TIGR04076 family)